MKFTASGNPSSSPREVYDATDAGNMLSLIHVTESVVRSSDECLQKMQEAGISMPEIFLDRYQKALGRLHDASQFYRTSYTDFTTQMNNDRSGMEKHHFHAERLMRDLIQLTSAANGWNEVYNDPQVGAFKTALMSPLPIYSSVVNVSQSLQKGGYGKSFEALTRQLAQQFMAAGKGASL